MRNFMKYRLRIGFENIVTEFDVEMEKFELKIAKVEMLLVKFL